LKEKFGDRGVLKYGGGRRIHPGKELELAVDVLIPGATGDVLGEKNMRNVRAKMIVEGANFPSNGAAQKYFFQKGILVVPDFVANAGAVMSTGPAMDNRYSCDVLEPRVIFETVKRKMWKNVTMVLEESKKRRRLPREVALAISQERVRKAMELRGRFPRKRRG
jgi:glutamate dehydrogenase (NAD(P)+)